MTWRKVRLWIPSQNSVPSQDDSRVLTEEASFILKTRNAFFTKTCAFLLAHDFVSSFEQTTWVISSRGKERIYLTKQDNFIIWENKGDSGKQDANRKKCWVVLGDRESYFRERISSILSCLSSVQWQAKTLFLLTRNEVILSVSCIQTWKTYITESRKGWCGRDIDIEIDHSLSLQETLMCFLDLCSKRCIPGTQKDLFLLYPSSLSFFPILLHYPSSRLLISCTVESILFLCLFFRE